MSECANGLTVLVVDDERSVRTFVRRTLELEGYKVLEAEDGEAGYGLACRHCETLCLLITDIVMPNMSGADLASMILDKCPRLPVLFISGFSSERPKPRRGTKFLAKPFSPQALLESTWKLISPLGC